MKVEKEIETYLNTLEESKRSDMQKLHKFILEIMPKCKLWYLDGKDDNGKIVSNPNIGYGHYTIKYANGSSRDFYQIGISANKTGISVYVLGLEDKTYLSKNYADKIGKASVSGYCIKFKNLKDIQLEVLKEAILFGIKNK